MDGRTGVQCAGGDGGKSATLLRGAAALAVFFLQLRKGSVESLCLVGVWCMHDVCVWPREPTPPLPRS